MRPPLKLNAIEQEHLQELYDAAGVARDELPYSEKFDEIWSGFQDRTFKNAEREQVFGAQLQHRHPEVFPRSLDQLAELAPEGLAGQRRTPGHVWLGGTWSAAGKIGKTLLACEGSRPRDSAGRIGW